MNQSVIDDLKNKLNRRSEQIYRANSAMIVHKIRSLLEFLNSSYLCSSILQNLEILYPHVNPEPILTNQVITWESEEEFTAIALKLLRLVIHHNLSFNERSNMSGNSLIFITQRYVSVTKEGTQETRLDVFKNTFIFPLFDYLIEKLDEPALKLYLLIRYKHRSEWFKNKYLAELVQEELEKVERKRLEQKKGDNPPKARIEKILAQDLYAYLFDEGLHFSIEPKSLRGEVDLIEAKIGNDRLLLDAKVFDNGKTRNKAYLLKAFQQIYSYTQQFNQPFGYLVIFKTCKNDLEIATEHSEQGIPFIHYNHKTIFFVVVDIHQYDEATSQREKLKAVQILEEEFVTYIDKHIEENPLLPTEE